VRPFGRGLPWRVENQSSFLKDIQPWPIVVAPESFRTASVLSASLLTALSIASPALAEPSRPNIVFIMADDLGNADLGYRGDEVRTPNIDKLATDGVKFEDFYGMPACTPSRAQL
jgi:Sulfatase